MEINSSAGGESGFYSKRPAPETLIFFAFWPGLLDPARSARASQASQTSPRLESNENQCFGGWWGWMANEPFAPVKVLRVVETLIFITLWLGVGITQKITLGLGGPWEQQD